MHVLVTPCLLTKFDVALPEDGSITDILGLQIVLKKIVWRDDIIGIALPLDKRREAQNPPACTTVSDYRNTSQTVNGFPACMLGS